MTEDIEIIKAVASDSKARIDRIILNYEELEKENAELKAEKQQIQEQVKKILLDDNAEIGDIKKLVGMDWYDVKEIEQLKYNLKCRDDELAESKAEIKQIIERERVVPEHYLIEMIDKNKELKERLKSEANEIIKDLLYCTDGIVEVSIPEENRFLSVKKLKARAEKFLKEACE